MVGNKTGKKRRRLRTKEKGRKEISPGRLQLKNLSEGLWAGYCPEVCKVEKEKEAGRSLLSGCREKKTVQRRGERFNETGNEIRQTAFFSMDFVVDLESCTGGKKVLSRG